MHFHALSQQGIFSAGRQRVRCHAYLRGFEVLGRAMRDHLEPTADAVALPRYCRGTADRMSGAEEVE